MDRKMTDTELRRRLEACGFDAGPLTDVSRAYWLRKLSEAERGGRAKPQRPKPPPRIQHPVRVGLLFPDEEDERLSRQEGDASISSDVSDSSDEEGSSASRREAEIQQRKAAVSKVQQAGARVLADVEKAHLKSRRSPFLLQYGLHAVVGALLAVAVVLLLNAVSYNMRRRAADSQDNFIWCARDQFCTGNTIKRIDTALKLANHLAEIADKQAGVADCTEGQNRDLKPATVLEVAKAFHLNNIEAKLALLDAELLFVGNPHWKVTLLTSNFVIVENNVTVENLNRIHLVSTNPMKPLTCRIRKAMHSAATQALLFAFLSFLLVLLFIAIRMFVQRREADRQLVFSLVDKILKHLQQVHAASLSGSSDTSSSAVPISHVRDALLPPAERQSQSAVWEKAVTWINQRESRVRIETRRIAGEDFIVWRWIPIASYTSAQVSDSGLLETDGGSPSGTANSPSRRPISPSSPAETLERREKQWGGHVLEHYSGDAFRQQVLPLAKQPSCCIKLRNLYTVQPRPTATEFEELESAVLHKLTQHGGVLHCFLDRWTDEGALYAKLDCAGAATSLIEALHGTWYNSRLVKAEYIALAEYHRLFPSSTGASKLLFPP
ncbi:inner nuclear membrane protein Man1-like [Sycon ciliatum]|uniref:inner nuclear membrane protein Man1-like n=1 Tax=Sycon ciliatum TaxID=27933 RepID=UPI0031F69711